MTARTMELGAKYAPDMVCTPYKEVLGSLMGAIGAAILARRNEKRASFDFSMEDMDFVTREVNCGRCPNNCEIICVYRNGELIDSWGNRCERGEISVNAVKTLKERHSSK